MEQDIELTWDNAEAWQKLANSKKEEEQPRWKWDCGFKLDFDGPLLSISSRFYPPHKNEGDWWEGNVIVYFMDTKILTKPFKSETLDGLRKDVEAFVSHYSESIKSRLKP